MTDTKLEDDFAEEEPFWRGVFVPMPKRENIFSKKVEIKLDELPSWEPYIVIDPYLGEDDDE